MIKYLDSQKSKKNAETVPESGFSSQEPCKNSNLDLFPRTFTVFFPLFPVLTSINAFFEQTNAPVSKFSG